MLNTHPMGDGAWFWYAKALRSGVRLYSDLHLPLQPLFILQTKWAMTVLGDGWLASKVPAFLQMIVYVFGLRLLAAHVLFNEWLKGLMLASAFFLSTLFFAYRFDDYHVPVDCMTVYSILLLFRQTNRTSSHGDTIRTELLLGLLSGLAITMRLNDGGILYLTVLVALFVLSPRGRWFSMFLFTAAAALTVFAVVHFTGDSFCDYASYSILRAAESKGGSSSVLSAPLTFPLQTIQLLFLVPAFRSVVVMACLAIGFACCFLSTWARGGPISFKRLAVLSLPLVLLAVFGGGKAFSEAPAVALSGVWMLIMLALGTVIAARLLAVATGRRLPGQWSSAEALLLIPIGQLLSGSMSSGGVFLGLFAPVGLFILLLAAAWPVALWRRWQLAFVAMTAVVILISTAGFKIRVPFSWHTYISEPMFTNRQWYRHPLYGPMMIENRQLSYMKGVCETLSHENSPPELLSAPFPYANYFCGIAPWHGYVQTFFDIASAGTVRRLIHELETSPPMWILYQRQPEILALHERIYMLGQTLPQRSLDTLIVAKLSSGQWQRVSDWNSRPDPSQSKPADNADWILIRTR